jgi:hypothetical protein
MVVLIVHGSTVFSREKIRNVTTMCMVVLIVQFETKVRFTKTMHNEYKTSKDLKCYQRKKKSTKDMINGFMESKG